MLANINFYVNKIVSITKFDLTLFDMSNNIRRMKDIKTLPPKETAAHFDYDNSLGWLMKSTLALLRQKIEAKTITIGLTFSECLAIFKLYFENANTVAELARSCTQDTGGMTRLLDKLETKGFCQRQRSETDRRVVNIVLTEKGLQLAREIPATLFEAQQKAFKDFSAEEEAQVKSYLRRILHTLQTTE